MRLCNEKGGYYSILQYAIAGHHSGLMDYYKLEERYRKSICDYQAYRQEVEIPQIKSDPFESCKTQNPHFSMGIFMRMLYSCLVDADFLETESFMKNNHVERTSGEEMASLLARLERHIGSWLENYDLNSINGRRTEILKACLTAGENDRGLFHLTVPTGGGKTIASLAFALKHAVRHQMEHIIYVIPYTSTANNK